MSQWNIVMNRFALAGRLTFAVVLGGSMSADAQGGYLASLQWKYRVLVVMAPSPHDENVTLQREIVQQNGPGMTERQIVLVEATGDDPRSRQIRRQLSLDDDRFKVVLIGKDGNAALTAVNPLSADRLFGTIDAMPMRKDEMRRDRR
jgi:hypothetical protein